MGKMALMRSVQKDDRHGAVGLASRCAIPVKTGVEPKKPHYNIEELIKQWKTMCC